jgi:hypothetical protein
LFSFQNKEFLRKDRRSTQLAARAQGGSLARAQQLDAWNAANATHASEAAPPVAAAANVSPGRSANAATRRRSSIINVLGAVAVKPMSKPSRMRLASEIDAGGSMRLTSEVAPPSDVVCDPIVPVSFTPAGDLITPVGAMARAGALAVATLTPAVGEMYSPRSPTATAPIMPAETETAPPIELAAVATTTVVPAGILLRTPKTLGRFDDKGAFFDV